MTENSLNPDITRKHLKYIAVAAERNQSLGFTSRLGRLGEPEEPFAHVLEVVKKAAGAKERGEWKVVAVRRGQGEASLAPAAAGLWPGVRGPREPFCPPNLTSEAAQTALAGINDREPHIRLLNDAIQTLVATNGELRAHTMLYGEPGGGKSTLLERLRDLLNGGQKIERMSWVDATTMSKAGLESWILENAEAETLPEIFVVK